MVLLRLSFAILLLCLLVGGAWLTAREGFTSYLVQPPRRPVSIAWRDSLGIPWRAIEVQVSPELLLRGWWFSGKVTGSSVRGIVVGLHGHGASKEQLLELPALLCPLGYDVVLYDSRAHGESDGAAGTFGYEEKEDLKRVIDHLSSVRPGVALAAYGLSYGGAVVLQTLPEEHRLSCAVVESTFSSLPAVIRSRVRSMLRLDWPLLADWVVQETGKKAFFPAHLVSPVTAAVAVRQPVFLSHGTSDSYIPFEQGEEIARVLKQQPDSEWHPVKGAEHVVLFSKAGQEYRREMLDFLAAHLQVEVQRPEAGMTNDE